MGSRLAFDAAKGRLWVVCRACDRWNLSPLEERWEAIEAMERRFRESRLRVSTDNVGLARLKEGVDLIRIGEPQRPEMAAWRYGDQFGRRRKRQMLITGTIVGSAVAVVGGMIAVGASVGSLTGVYANGGIWDALINGRQSVSIGKIALPDGELVDVQRKHARMSALERGVDGGPLQLRLESVSGTHLLLGDHAMKAAARLLPTVNRFGGSLVQVQDAVSLLEEIGDPLRVLTSVQQRVGATTGDARWGVGKSDWFGSHKRNVVKKLPGTLHTLTPRDRLALEMALHEESERRAMDGELAALELAWAEAEQIAKIADDMFLPPSMDEQLDNLRDR
ncbi:hypothetical protein [Gemmatimonas groenlandica]|uniref:Uncharacterized protein n=1 Tax=Gemmatimonas groenlandica TaxID=2732249 RepID=A0A6M4ITP4_9BACT|nr:hypothetical protein [Gemmatimonas groenlandica]QJR35631.1 hypothetical protein HKW67_08970 [Gemmatimonas groenlandica]